MLDAEEKTVARLRTESVDDGTSQLRIQPLRGYDAEADRIARLLARVDGFSAVSATPYDLALTHAESQPRQREPPECEAASRKRLRRCAIAEMLTEFAAAIEENVPGTIASIDTEFLHDLRVAVRRTRSILKLVGDVLPDQLAERFAAGFQMAWRSDHAGPRSRRLPARARHRWRPG